MTETAAGDGRPAALAHHFETLEQQHASSGLGMWLFLVTEVMFFGGLFTAYVLYRALYPDAFTDGSRHLDVVLGALNTAVLITSSLTMALAVRSAQTGDEPGISLFLLATVALGAAFLVIKGVEYSHKWHEGLLPGVHFAHEGPHRRGTELFFSLYFVMTGTHAAHMVIGIGVMLVLTVGALRGRFGDGSHAPVEMAGLYWHFVDVVWIFLFPLLYLIGRHG